ncbi:MAG: Carbohydrate-selective porin [bacterium]|nr:MAG: Carbohydrate-selective porin [bacterium]
MSVTGTIVAIALNSLPYPSDLRDAATSAQAHEPAWTWQAAYTVDVIGVVGGIDTPAGRFLDNLEVAFDGDLDRGLGWRGARAHFSLLANGGGEPNALAGTLQGYDNIEVGAQGVRLYEAWLEQDLADGKASVLAGLYDVNSEFYVSGAADLLLSPPFGVGSELAATGPNGPAIFPSTSLTVRLRLGGTDGPYAQVAAVNARAGTIGDHGGVDTTFDHGLLYLGVPALSPARGAYLVTEGTLFEADAAPTVRAFLRLGVSDGDTTDFRGGWQAGLRVDSVFAGRPDSALSLGFQQGILSAKARANAADAGDDFAEAEGGVELTYSDTLGPFTVQPDVQWIYNPGGDRNRDAILAAGLRLILTLR